MMRRKLTVVTAASLAVLTMLAGCGGSGFDDSSSDAKSGGLTDDSSKGLTVLIGSSGDTETEAVKKAVADWA